MAIGAAAALGALLPVHGAQARSAGPEHDDTPCDAMAVIARSYEAERAGWLRDTLRWIDDYRRAGAVLNRDLYRSGEDGPLARHRAAVLRHGDVLEGGEWNAIHESHHALRREHDALREAHRNLIDLLQNVARGDGPRHPRPEIAEDRPH